VRLTTETGVASHLACSPSGRWLAYYRIRGAERELRVVPTSGGSPVTFGDPSAQALHPAWSNDSSRLAFVSGSNGSRQVWVQGFADGTASGPPRKVTSDRAAKRWPAWSPDDKQIAYTFDAAGDRSEIAIVSADGNGPPRVITSGAGALRVRWIGGTRPIWVTGLWGDKDFQVRVLNPDGTEALALRRPLLFGGDYLAGNFDLTRDGRRLVFARTTTSGNIWILEAAAGHF
jgi:Tol biopolymer transport system component